MNLLKLCQLNYIFLERRFNKVSENEKQKKFKKSHLIYIEFQNGGNSFEHKKLSFLEDQKMNQRISGYSSSMRPKSTTCKLFNDV